MFFSTVGLHHLIGIPFFKPPAKTVYQRSDRKSNQQNVAVARSFVHNTTPVPGRAHQLPMSASLYMRHWRTGPKTDTMRKRRHFNTRKHRHSPTRSGREMMDSKFNAHVFGWLINSLIDRLIDWLITLITGFNSQDTEVLIVTGSPNRPNSIRLDANMFANKKFKEIHLSYAQNLDYIGERTFQLVSSSLLVLNMTHNALRVVSENNFRNLTFLTHLHLDYNRIASVHSAMFSYLTNLKVLTLTNNLISDVPQRMGMQLGKLEVQGMIQHFQIFTTSFKRLLDWLIDWSIVWNASIFRILLAQTFMGFQFDIQFQFRIHCSRCCFRQFLMFRKNIGLKSSCTFCLNVVIQLKNVQVCRNNVMELFFVQYVLLSRATVVTLESERWLGRFSIWLARFILCSIEIEIGTCV